MAIRIKQKIISFFTDKDGKIVLAQWPNTPILGWLLFKVAALLATSSQVEAGFSTVSTAFLFTWAFLEIQSGATRFRRLLGLLVMTFVVIGFFRG